jgi:hypothetical protein
MKKTIVIIASVIAASASFAGKPTFESVQTEFQQKVLSLVADKDTPMNDLQSKLAELSNETFGAHPDLMRKVTEKRFKDLPIFPAADLASYVEHESLDQFPLLSNETGCLWAMFGWDPEKLATSTKVMILARKLGPERYGRLALLNTCCPDKIYRLGKGKFPDLVVESLGDLFLIKVEMTEVGVCKPSSVRWMKKKASRTTESTPTK